MGGPVYGWLKRAGSTDFPDLVLRLDPAGVEAPEAPGSGGETASGAQRGGGGSTAIPNPSGSGTRTRFTLPRADHATLVILDSRGIEIARALDALRQAGPQSVLWDGRNRSGRPVPAGVHYYRLSAGDRAVSGKALVVR